MSNIPNWAGEAEQFTAALTEERCRQLAAALGVTESSLRAIRCGWARGEDLRRLKASGEGWQEAFPEWAWSFPECSADGTVIGMGFRAPDGRKGAAAGGKRGLTIPTDWASRRGPILDLEGPSDVAAALTMGINAVGRPSNRGGVEHLGEFLKDSDSIVLGENDARLVVDKGMVWPGADGAQSVATGLAKIWGKPVRMSMPPKPHKDVRVWLNARAPDPSDAAACEAAGRELMDLVMANAQAIEPPPPTFTVQIERHEKKAKATVTARVDGQIVVVDEFNPASSKRRDDFVQLVLTKDKRLDQGEVEKALLTAATAPSSTTSAESLPLTREELLDQNDQQAEELLAAMPPEAVQQATAMLLDPLLINLILQDIEQVGVVGEGSLAITIYIMGVSRLLSKPDKPVSGIVQGLSSSGKSHVISATGSLFPPEEVVRCTDMTPQALYYLSPGALLHKLILAGERSRREDSDRAEATRALREMISEGMLTKIMTAKENGRLETKILHRDGPIAFIESTTLTNIFDEDANRCLLLGTDESAAQTRQVMLAEARRSQAGASADQTFVLRHHALQRMLRRVTVLVPFAERLAQAMPSERPEGRRAFSHALGMIKAIALLHQRQRCRGPLDHGDTISASLVDYRIAKRLLIGPLARALGGALPMAVTNLAKRLSAQHGGEVFSTTKGAAEDAIIKSQSKMGQYLKTLLGAGVVEQVTAARGNQPAEWKVVADPPEAGSNWLPEAEALEGPD